MTPDVVAELLRQLMKEAMILTAPVLIVAVVLGFVLTLLQTLTSLQDQSLTSVPRLGAVAVILLVGMPWFLGSPDGVRGASDERPSPISRVRGDCPMGRWTEFFSAMLLTLIRVSGIFVFAPFFSSSALPVRAKAVFGGSRGVPARSPSGIVAKCSRGDRFWGADRRGRSRDWFTGSF